MNKILNITDKKTTFNKNFGKFNVIFGPNKSGKSFYFDYLYNVFLAKTSATINGEEINKNDFEVVKLTGDLDISSILKLNNKNEYKKKLIKLLNTPDFQYLKEKQINILNEMQGFIDESLNKNSSLKWSFSSDNIDETIIELIDGEITGSNSEITLETFNTFINVESAIRKKIILIDDFDIRYDENSTVKLLQELRLIDSYVFLFTNKPQSIFYLNIDEIFCCRNNKLINLKTLFDKIIEVHNSLQDYLLNDLYDDIKIKSLEKQEFVYSIGRIIVNNDVCVDRKDGIINCVNIYTKTENEKIFLLKIINALDNC